MPHRFAVHVATTGREIGGYRTQNGAEASALRLSTQEVYLEVSWLDRGEAKDGGLQVRVWAGYVGKRAIEAHMSGIGSQ